MFAIHTSLEIQIFFACHQLNHLNVVRLADQMHTASTVYLIRNVCAILVPTVIHTMDVEFNTSQIVPRTHVERTPTAVLDLMLLNAFVPQDLLETPTFDVSILMNVMEMHVEITQYALTQLVVTIVVARKVSLEIHLLVVRSYKLDLAQILQLADAILKCPVLWITHALTVDVLINAVMYIAVQDLLVKMEYVFVRQGTLEIPMIYQKDVVREVTVQTIWIAIHKKFASLSERESEIVWMPAANFSVVQTPSVSHNITHLPAFVSTVTMEIPVICGRVVSQKNPSALHRVIPMLIVERELSAYSETLEFMNVQILAAKLHVVLIKDVKLTELVMLPVNVTTPTSGTLFHPLVKNLRFLTAFITTIVIPKLPVVRTL